MSTSSSSYLLGTLSRFRSRRLGRLCDDICIDDVDHNNDNNKNNSEISLSRIKI